MRNNWAEDFYEILESLRLRPNFQQNIEQLIQEKEIKGKVLEGGTRVQDFKNILLKLIAGQINLEESYRMVEQSLSPNTSIHRGNNRVFPHGWGERLARTQLSRFYNQAVLLHILTTGENTCFIPHSQNEQADSSCLQIAGTTYAADILLQRLEDSYEKEIYTEDVKIPNHPHCTHVVMPI